MKIFSEKNVKISKFIFSKCRNRSCQNRFKALPILKFKFSWSNKRLRKENITQVLLKVHFSFDKQERKFSIVLLIVKQVSLRSLSRGVSMILKISWAADPCRPGTVWFRSELVPSCQINYQKFGESMFGESKFSRPIFYRSKSTIQGVAKLLTRDFAT